MDVKESLTSEQDKSVDEMVAILRNWNGSFDMDSVAATLYIRWKIQFYRNLFCKYIDDESQRMALGGNYHFTDTYLRLVDGVLADKEQSHWQVVCEDAYPAFKGKNACAYNMAMALVESHQFLATNVSPDSSKWLWGDHHVNDYVNMPFSKTMLKPIFHRSVAVPGNDNTPNVSKLNLRKSRDDVVIKSAASANFKMLIELAKDPKDEVGLFSIDTGMNGHPFQGNYFDYNQDHLDGRLKPMKRGYQLEGTPVDTLVLKPREKREANQADSSTEL